MNLFRRNLTFLFFCIISFQVYPQGIKYLTMDDGLSSNQVFQVEKDTTGFIWFVTHMGIDRFDGSQIKSYTLTGENQKYENYPPFTQMVLNKQKEIVVALHRGQIFRYNKQIDDFELFLDVSEKINYSGFLLHYIYFDTSNRLWVSSNYGLYVFNTETKEYRNLSLFDKVTPTRVIENGTGVFYVGTNESLYMLEEGTPNNFKVTGKLDFGRQYGIVTSLINVKNRIYIGTEQKGLFVFDPGRKTSRSLYPTIPNVYIRSLNYTSDNRLIVGADGSGLYIMDVDNDELVMRYDSDNNQGDGLSSNSVYDIAVDETNCIWVTTYANGINILDPLKLKISIFRHEHNEINSLINNQVNTVFEDSDENLWFGTNNGISCYLAKTKEWKHYLNNSDRKAVIVSFGEDKQKRIWAGGYGTGAVCINKKTGEIKTFQKDNTHPQQSINTNYVYAFYVDDQSVWIGGTGGMLSRYNISDHTFRYYNIEVISQISALNDSVLALSTATGICLLNTKTSYFKQYDNWGWEHSFYGVRRFYVAGKDEVWLGTEGGGLICFNPQTEEFQAYTVDDGLPSNYICSIEGDEKDGIWISCERTLSYFNRKTRKFTNIGQRLGLNNFSYNHYASTRRHNDNLVFGTPNGAVEFSPDNMASVDIHAKLIFTDFKLFYNSVRINEENSPLKQAVNETEAITLNHRQNFFSFVFSAINYRSQKQILYTYMLENFDPEWYIAADNNTVSYTNIKPGNYRFRLKALNKETGDVVDERNIAIHIQPPFYQSVWAYVIYALLIFLLLWFAFLYVKNAVEKRHSKEKIRFFIDMAHDIRTPVSLIKAPLSDLADNENLSENGATLLDIAIRNTEKLFTMITQLLDFQKADMLSLRLIASKNELKTYISEKIVQFKITAEQKNISLTSEIGFDRLEVWFDREKMDKIVDNLLSNAIKYTESGGKVHIRFSEDEKHWYLSVIDTGIGIPSSEQKNLFKRFFRARNAINSKETGSGIGLLLTKELVKLHGGSISFTSKENQGTEFNLTFLKEKQFFLKKGMPELSETEENKEILPEKREITAIPESGREPDTSMKKVKILLVEDNDDMRLYLRRSLSDQYRIEEASDGQEALDRMEEINPDLIISDNLMPRLNGDEMCAKLKSSIETSHIPVILLTALADKESIIKGLNAAADDYITKPFDVAILKARIQNILQNRDKLKTALISHDEMNVTPEYTNPLDKEFMEKAIRLIEENLNNAGFSMSDLSSGMAMSYSSLFRKMKALTGQGANDFIRTIRLNRAKELLLTGQYNVFETSEMTGFPDTKYFAVAFKKQFGVSPSKVGKS